MILVSAHDPLLRAAVEHCARPDEAVVTEPYWVQEARETGYARVHVRDDRPAPFPPLLTARVPELFVSPEMLHAWQHQWRKQWRKQ